MQGPRGRGGVVGVSRAHGSGRASRAALCAPGLPRVPLVAGLAVGCRPGSPRGPKRSLIGGALNTWSWGCLPAPWPRAKGSGPGASPCVWNPPARVLAFHLPGASPVPRERAAEGEGRRPARCPGVGCHAAAPPQGLAPDLPSLGLPCGQVPAPGCDSPVQDCGPPSRPHQWEVSSISAAGASLHPKRWCPAR